jgi:hypothetical protein
MLSSPSSRSSFRRIFLTLGVALVPLGCPSDSEGETDEASDTETGDCTPGSLGCECVVDECLGELSCVDGICTEISDDTTTTTGDDATTTDDDATTDDTTTDDDTTDDTTTGDGDVNTCESPNGAFGCEFQAVKLRISSVPYDPQWSMRIAVGNPGPDHADVVVEKRVDGQWTNVAGPVLVPANEMYSFFFHGGDDVVPVGHHEGYAYRVTSTSPIAAHQYNADTGLGWSHAATNLLPTSVWDYDYDGISVGPNGNQDTPYLVVVAHSDNTTVQIDPKNTVQGGPDVPPTNGPFSVFMQAGDVIGIYGAIGTSMSGTRITSDPNHKIAVFAGDSFDTLVKAFQHFDEQLIGRNYAGTAYLSLTGPAPFEGNDPWDGFHWLYALSDVTAITVTGTRNTSGLPPAPTVVNAQSLLTVLADSNMFPEFGDVLVESTKPMITLGKGMLGDNKVAQMIPLDRLATRYAIPVIDLDEDLEMTVAYPDGATLILNGMQLGGGLYVAYSPAPGWNVRRFKLYPGMYVLEASEPVAVVLTEDDFAFSGGMQP